jgi:hypothetical protein
MNPNAEKELDAMKRIIELLQPFAPPARHRILGWVKHFMKSPAAGPTSEPSKHLCGQEGG